MKTQKHTPGPWRIGNAGTAIFHPNKPKYIANLTRCENLKANALLIAAAPELLAACEKVIADMQSDTFKDNLVNEVTRKALVTAIHNATKGA